MDKKNSITSMILGIASIVLGLNGLESAGICGIAGLVCAILSMNFGKKALAAGAENGFTKAGKITSIIGLILSIIGLIGGLICAICLCVTGVGAAALGNY